jgi:AcrR family transcriptional regulator
MITDVSAPTRERILDAAVELFGRQGYSGTSVGEIEAAAGLVPRSGGLYKHFASKRALLEAAVARRARVAEDAGEQVDTALVGDVRAELRTVGRASLRIVADDQALMRIVMREGDGFPELRDEFYGRIVDRGQRSFVTWLRLAARRTGAPEPDLDALASLILGSIINHCVLSTLFGHAAGDVSDERFLDTWTDSTLKLLEAHGLVGDEQAPKEGPA